VGDVHGVLPDDAAGGLRLRRPDHAQADAQAPGRPARGVARAESAGAADHAGPAWKPVGDENPSWRILGLLALTIGLPYFILSTTSPLLQAWFARRFHHAIPYRLFALSNLASLLALLAYPVMIEPWISTFTQSVSWSLCYALFALLCGYAAYASVRGPA
jgi:hypothetical protein